MRVVKWPLAAVALGVVLTLVGPDVARAQVVSSDIQRLQDSVSDVAGDLSRLRGRDAATADRLQVELEMLREEVIYLKVKLRKEGTVTRAEYTDVRDRLDDVRWQARGEARANPGATPSRAPSREPDRGAGVPVRPGITQADEEIPVGTELDVRLQSGLDSGTARVEDRFQATTLVDLSAGGRVRIPAGSVVRGMVTSVDRAGRLDRRGRLTVGFDQVMIDGRVYPLRGTLTQALQSDGLRGEAGKIGTGAGVGAVIGGILGGLKGALTGVLIGAGGTLAATEGNDVNLPPGTVLRIRLDSPPVVR